MWNQDDFEKQYRDNAFGRELATAMGTIDEHEFLIAQRNKKRLETCKKCLTVESMAGTQFCKHNLSEFRGGQSPCEEYGEKKMALKMKTENKMDISPLVEKMMRDESKRIELMIAEFMVKNQCQLDDMELVMTRKQDFTFETTVKLKEPKLNPCGCGGLPFIDKTASEYYGVWCGSCGMHTAASQKHDAIKKWNAAIPLRNDGVCTFKQSNIMSDGKTESLTECDVWVVNKPNIHFCPACGRKLGYHQK